MFKKVLRIFLYLSFALLFSLLILIWKFPYAALEARIQHEVHKRSSYQMTKPELSFALPFALQAQKVSILDAQKNKPALFELSDVNLTPDLTALIKGSLGINLKSSLYQGELTGKIQTRSLALPAETSLQLFWEHLDLNGYPQEILTSPIFDLQGKLSGEISYKGKLGSLAQTSGQGHISCQGLSIRVKIPLLQIKDIQDLLLNGKFSFQKQKLIFEEGQFSNEWLEGNVSGDIHLKNNLPQSSLNLQGKIKVDPKLIDMSTTTAQLARLIRKQKFIPFRISGTLGDAKLNML